jgi:C1A family cysteine protease
MEPDFTKYPINYVKRDIVSDIRPSDIDFITIDPSITKSIIDTPFIFDQGTINSCVSNAIALYVAIIVGTTKINHAVSRLFIYYNGRVLGNYDTANDTGMSVYDGCNSFQQYTPPFENLWPYSVSNYAVKPLESLYNTPFSDLTNIVYLQIRQNIVTIKSYIISKTPVIFAITIFPSFYTAGKTGIVVMPNVASEISIGAHCVLIVGFDDSKQMFICANSWGTKFGNRGIFMIPYEYVINPQLAFDFYILQFTVPVQTTSPLILKSNTLCCGLS